MRVQDVVVQRWLQPQANFPPKKVKSPKRALGFFRKVNERMMSPNPKQFRNPSSANTAIPMAQCHSPPPKLTTSRFPAPARKTQLPHPQHAQRTAPATKSCCTSSCGELCVTPHSSSSSLSEQIDLQNRFKAKPCKSRREGFSKRPPNDHANLNGTVTKCPEITKRCRCRKSGCTLE